MLIGAATMPTPRIYWPSSIAKPDSRVACTSACQVRQRWCGVPLQLAESGVDLCPGVVPECCYAPACGADECRKSAANLDLELKRRCASSERHDNHMVEAARLDGDRSRSIRPHAP